VRGYVFVLGVSILIFDFGIIPTFGIFKRDFEFQAKCIVLTYLQYDGLVIK
jgi:hypothetical protein